ncbi:hypothetical protein [Bacillus sp. FJAT-28004]|uniref:hypothetical protein n=1 Tax=Bacillus sp. FJAT-28004 TaxID=1679165 RepID=UPI0006B48FEC|nr:hypothetical protein [Bacillus sp. FJAT-28004]
MPTKHTFKRLAIYFELDTQEMVILSCRKSLDSPCVEQIDVVQTLAAPYSMPELVGKLKLAFEQCFTKDVEASRVSPIEKVLKIRGYSKATKNRKLVLVEWKKSDGYLVSPTVRTRGYEFLPDQDIMLPLQYTETSWPRQ